MSQPPQKTFQVNEKVKKTAIKAGKYVGIKLLKWAAFLLVLALAWWYFFGGSGGNGSSSGSQSNNPKLPATPKDTVRGVYNAVSSNISKDACLFFSREGAEAFARNMNAVNCQQAMDDAAAQVQDKNAYANPKITDQAALTSGPKSEISSCAMEVVGGKKLGAFLLTRQPDGGWQITGHEAEPADCVTG